MKHRRCCGYAVLLAALCLSHPAAAKTRPAKVGRFGLGSRAVASKLLAGRVTSAWMRAAGGIEQLPGTLRWPVARGWLSRGFGSGPGGYHLALDIIGKVGWAVRAAAPGIVGYAGDGLRGYGNVVMLIHPGGWVTLYAHNSKNLVRAGSRVKLGTPIAKVGNTGASRGPHLHFELIHRGKNCDPAPLMRPGIRHRNGKRTGPKRRVWRDPAAAPEGVACHRRRHKPSAVPHDVEPEIEPETDEAEETETP